MSKTQTSRSSENNTGSQDSGSGLNSGFTRYGYDKRGSLCVLDVTFPNGERKTFNEPGNSRSAARVAPEQDLNTSAFPAAKGPHHPFPGTFARMGYDNGVLVVLESGNYRRGESKS